VAGLAGLLSRLAGRPLEQRGAAAMLDATPAGEEKVRHDQAAQVRGERRGETTLFVCPECGGTLWQADEEKLVLFRCHVGHVLSAGDLLDGQAEGLEAALWSAVRILTDQELLARQLAGQERRRGDDLAAAHYEQRADAAAG